jgi:micrococcal nuclease
VIDGDTFVLTDGEIIRLIGVDTPELALRDSPAQYYSQEAKAYLKALIEGKDVTLRSDQRGRDRYGRTLAYAHVGQRTFINLEIVRQGFGFVYTRFPFDYMDEFLKEEKRVREGKRGLWARDLAQEGLRLVRHSDAGKHYGERVMVTGKVVRTYNSGRACFLNFSEDWKQGFSAVVFASSFHKFPDSPEKYYLNKDVRLVGVVREYKGAPEIVLNDQTEIEIVQPQ